jgi:hypothetical protein
VVDAADSDVVEAPVLAPVDRFGLVSFVSVIAAQQSSLG